MPIQSSDVIIDNVPLLVDGSAVTQPISAVALPLPAGAATNAAVLALTKPGDIQLVDGSAHTQPVSGSVTVTNFPATQPISGTVTVANPGLTDTQLRATPVPISGSVSTTPSVATASTVTSTAVPLSTLTTILVSNPNRRAAIITVPSAATYVKFGTGASAASFTYKTPAANTVIETEVWTGIITVFGPAQTVLVTELT